MRSSIRRNASLVLVLGSGVLGLALGGCQNKEQQAQMEQMAATNAELQQQRDQAARELESARAQAQQADAERARLASELAAKQSQPQPPQWTDNNPPSNPPPVAHRDIVIEMAGDVTFAAGSADLLPAAKKELDSVARKLNGQWSNNYVRVEGFTDSDPPKKSAKKFPTNEALSQARAESVVRYLASKGVGSSRMEALGRGAANPKATKAASRRVEIHILGS